MRSFLDVEAIRRQFPALQRTHRNQPVVFLDGPAGSQVPNQVIEAVSDYMRNFNANTQGAFATSVESDALLAEAREAVADLLGTDDPDLVAFGPNMTSLTFALSRALADRWEPDDEILVTRMDHDANVWPWVTAARDVDANVRYIEINPDDCTLDLDDLDQKLTERTRLVAFCGASNAVGTINPIGEICARAQDMGAEVFVDAVHYAPHQLIDVRDWGCDYLACSAYKFYGPHVGVLWGKPEHMRTLPAYQVRPAGDEIPNRWQTGTQNHEGIAGVLAAIRYLAAIGGKDDRRASLAAAFDAIAGHESQLASALWAGLSALPHLRLIGNAPQRTPTISFTHRSRSPEEVARALAEQGIFVWHGNFYALELTQALDLEPNGMVRLGLMHYNTLAEVERTIAALGELD
jgi:cysteine desulfurase family protein (TIGR01976 family)